MSGHRQISTQVLGTDEQRLEVDGAELRVVVGPDKGMRIPLGVESQRLGSASDCEIVLHDAAVSARHAEVSLSPRGYTIRDLGSKNGLYLGTWRIDRAPLGDGMRLGLGGTVLTVHRPGDRRNFKLARAGDFGGLAVHSLGMRAAVSTLEQLAASDVTVLIEGETGTGKEVAAHALHAASSRSHGPFVVFDCAAVGPSLAASELFGHEKGAFTGAHEARAGLLEQAQGGTLFIDEIGELPLELQPLLLGAIDRKTSRRIGGKADLSHDLRIVAATNRNLAEEVRAGRFRQDLYFRLTVGRVRLPPLRERPEDVVALAQAFALEVRATLSPQLLALLPIYDWPGNVRELRNTIARFAAQPDQPIFSTQAVGDELPLATARQRALETFERRYLAAKLAEAAGSLSRAAERAGISRQYMHTLAMKYGLRPPGRKGEQ